MTHILVTNDYPPKVGGIQNYLWELWRRLPQDSFEVLTSPHSDSSSFDVEQAHQIWRYDRPWLGPSRRLCARVRDLADRTNSSLTILDPTLPLGAIGPRLGVPYATVLHGAEVSVPARIPIARRWLSTVLDEASLVISASRFAEAEASRGWPDRIDDTVYVPPGVDTDKFVPFSESERAAHRRRLGLDPERLLVVGISRLVPRKGFDVLVAASARLARSGRSLDVLIAGSGRDEQRLRRLVAQAQAPVRLLGFVEPAELPALYASADVFVMLCRSRWLGLEQEGFGIVFVEAAAAGCPQIAGGSGGAAEAVAHGYSGLVVEDPTDVDSVAQAIDLLIQNPDHRKRLAAQARRHAVENFDYDRLAGTLAVALDRHGGL